MKPLGLDPVRDALLYVPVAYRADTPMPLALSCHGAGGDAQGGLYPLFDLADEFGFLLLAPSSRGRTWDVILGDFGPDVAFLDLALAATFARCAVDPTHLAMAGFSDGASYALSLGLMNGDLFTHLMAFSPGFLVPEELHGQPPVYISHGVQDRVLPIDRCSRRIVPVLEADDYAVTYTEFDGPHTVPTETAREAASWFLRSTS